MMSSVSSLRYSLISRATWSFLDLAVWSFFPADPIFSASAASMFMWISSSSSLNLNFPDSISADISAKIMRQIFFSIGWEGIFEGDRTSGRVLLDLTSRL